MCTVFREGSELYTYIKEIRNLHRCYEIWKFCAYNIEELTNLHRCCERDEKCALLLWEE
jgi:hypothetical protein